MADVSKIDFGDGVKRNIKDVTARAIATTQSVGRVKPDGTTITIDANGTISSSGSGGASEIVKTRYNIPTNWSSGSSRYSYSLSLSPSLSTSYAPTISFGWDSNAYYPFAGEQKRAMYNLIETAYLESSSVLTLYARAKPTTSFDIYVEGKKA